MDHINALRQLRSPELLRLALQYAIYDRRNLDYFFDPFEIAFADANRESIVSELVEELESPATYLVRNAFIYYVPKTDLCDRRMTYLQIKDLTVRYAIAILFSNAVEFELHPSSFANRRDASVNSAFRFTEDFATGGWSRFASWQRIQCQGNSVLLRTDISSFYDSISHDYLIDSVCRVLNLPENSQLVLLLRRLLSLRTIHYSSETGMIEGPIDVRHGLPIGDGVEGFLANIFLKESDDAMSRLGASYGRYNDDIRLFGNSRADVLQHLRVLQEILLAKGLNLNASKTRIAENSESIEELISRAYLFYDYGGDENHTAGVRIETEIDRPMHEFDRRFEEADGLESDADARDFCKYLSSHSNGMPMLARANRQPWHVARIVEIIENWRGSTRHACWLLVQTASFSDISIQTKDFAIRSLIQLLSSNSQNTYSRFRIVYHLNKQRLRNTNEPFRYVDQIPAEQRDTIIGLIPTFLGASGFELNLAGLQLAFSEDQSIVNLQNLAVAHSQSGCEPIRNALGRPFESPVSMNQIDDRDSESEENELPY